MRGHVWAIADLETWGYTLLTDAIAPVDVLAALARRELEAGEAF